MKKAIVKRPVKVLYETHTRELRMATNNKPIRNPYLSDSEKSVIPYEDTDEQEEHERALEGLFYSGELSHIKKVGRLQKMLRKNKISFEYNLEDEEFEVYLLSEEHVDPLPYYIYVCPETGGYTFSKYTTEYEEIYGAETVYEFRQYLNSLHLVKRKSI